MLEELREILENWKSRPLSELVAAETGPIGRAGNGSG